MLSGSEIALLLNDQNLQNINEIDSNSKKSNSDW